LQLPFGAFRDGDIVEGGDLHAATLVTGPVPRQ
jgi:hypothetical protein